MGKKIYGQGKPGLLYFAQNPAFHHLTKIGITEKLDVKDRGLSASNVPDDFGYPAVLSCKDAEWAEERVHEHVEKFRHKSNTGRSTEFFWSGCVQDAIRFARDLKGVSDATEAETEEIEVTTDDGGKKGKRIPSTTFEMIGIPIGTEVFFDNDESIVAVVKDKRNKVEYKGEVISLSPLSWKLSKEMGKGFTTWSGFTTFYHNGKRLFDLRPDQQDKE